MKTGENDNDEPLSTYRISQLGYILKRKHKYNKFNLYIVNKTDSNE